MNQRELLRILAELLKEDREPILPRGYRDDFRPYLDEDGKIRCAAKTRKGEPCKAQGLGRGHRCKNHGGMSTGAKTPEGRERQRAGAKAWWRRYREDRFRNKK